MNNIIHRHQAQGKSINERKVLAVAKNPLYKPEATEIVESTGEEVKTAEQTEQVSDKVQQSNQTTAKDQQRQQWSALEKARKLEADAKNKLAKAEQLSAAYQSGDLEAIARANNKSVSDYVRWVNQTAISAPTKKELTPEAQQAIQAKEWREKIDAKVSKLDEEVNVSKKYGYMNKNIIPHLVKDPDKFEFIHDRGLDEVASEVYDFMNQHYTETGGAGVGEELDPIPLLEALEQQYFEEWQAEEKIREEKKAKLKKLQTKPETTITPSIDAAPKVIGAKTVAHPSAKSEAEILTGINGAVIDEDALAETAPSNFIAGPTHGTTKRVNGTPGFATGGTTPKGSKFSREARLAAMSKVSSGE